MTGIETSGPFLTWLASWYGSLETIPFADAIPHPERMVLMSQDMVQGFVYEGPLASPRVAGIVPAVVALFQRARAAGVDHYVLMQDCHQEEAIEFSSFGRHCVCGSEESETIPELLALPFRDRFTIIPKNSISSSAGTTLDAWLNARHQQIDTFVIVGDCTDICVFDLAMHLRLRANANGYPQRVIVPADCVQTYDLAVDRARDLGIMPHDGALLHTIFLYQMALNGIEVVASLT
jgi:nicotinamidase-related amidase